MRLVLDTNIVVAAMRSPAGASASLLTAVRLGLVTILANVALALEYQATCRRDEHMHAAGLAIGEVDIFLSAILAMAEPVESHFMWRPQLQDAGDEFILDAAVNGRADAIVTFNARDFGVAPSHFGLEILTPRQVLGRIVWP